jgi:hypothetical protein
MIHNWNVDQIIAECRKMYWGANDRHMDGWNNWSCKQDLYRVKFAVEEMLQNTSKFTPENEWLVQQEKEHMWTALNKR